MISNLRWLCERFEPDASGLLGPIAPAGAAVLRGASAAVRRPGGRGDWRRWSPNTARSPSANTPTTSARFSSSPTMRSLLQHGQMLLSRRTMSSMIGMTGSIIAAATVTDTRALLDRLLGRGRPENGHRRPGAQHAVGGSRTCWATCPPGRSRRSTVCAPAWRWHWPSGDLALGENGLWVALGALSVLRSSAANTRTSVVRALTGTAIGFVIGSMVIAVVGVDPSCCGRCCRWPPSVRPTY